jgi:hypothetical protein
MAPAYRPDLADGWLDIRIVEAAALARSRLIAAVLTGTLGRSRVYRTWHARSVGIQAVDGQPIWLSTDGEVATAESGFVHGKHPHELMVYRRQGPSHAGHADVPDDAPRVGHGHYREQQREIRHELRWALHDGHAAGVGGASHPLLRRVMCPGTPRRRLRGDPERASRRASW